MLGLVACVNHLVSQVHPQFSSLLHRSKSYLHEHPAVRPLLNIWHSDFHGHAVVMNCQTGEHQDSKGVRQGLDVLVAARDFTGGAMFLRDLNVWIPFQPGTLIAFDGTAQ
jgi:hypothetical protein